MNAPSGLFQRREADRLGRSRSLAVIATLCAAVLGACSTNLGNSGANEAALQAPAAPIPDNAKPGQPVKIAMLLPLAGMGPAAHVAKSLKQAGEMALFERDNPNVRLIVKDDGGSAEGARLAAEQATKDGAEIILGPLFAQAVSGAAPVARAANLPVIAFSNDPRVAGNGVYLMSFLAKPEVERIVSFAASKGKRRFASLVPADAYGDTVDPAFRAAVARAGGTLVHADRYPVTANAMIEPVKRVAEAIRQAELAGAPVDALFLPGGQDTLPQLVPLLAYNGIDPQKVKLLGTGAWDYPNVGREQALAGAWYPGPDPRGWQDFSARFARTFGAAPPRIATLAYDAVSLAVTLSANPPGQRYTSATLTASQGFNGVDGTVAFAADGMAARGLAVLEIQQYSNAVIDPAPGSAGGSVTVPYADASRARTYTPVAPASGPPVMADTAPPPPAVTGSVDLPPPQQ